MVTAGLFNEVERNAEAQSDDQEVEKSSSKVTWSSRGKYIFVVMEIDILAIGVHPDDIELSAVGTLLSHVAQGYSVGLLDLTRGELGSRGTPEIRRREADEAARMIGVRFRENLGLEDGFIKYEKKSILGVVRVLRHCRPRIVLANALDDRHPDHGRAAKIIADACFYSGLLKIETRDELGNLQEKWRPQAVYHYIQDQQRQPDLVVDITAHLGRKMEIIRCYRSQFEDHQTNEFRHEPKTPISGADFTAFVEAKNRVFGRDPGFTYAEGFEVRRCPGVKDLFDLV